MKKIILLLIAISICSSLFAQSFKLNDQTVTESQYVYASPYINADRLRVRDLPVLQMSNILTHLNSNTPIKIRAITTDLYEINGESFPWYQIETLDDDSITGWVYGKYVSFRDDYPLEFWLEEHFIQRVGLWNYEKIAFQRQIIAELTGDLSFRISKERLDNYQLLQNTDRTIPNFQQSNLQEYRTPFGRLWILHNENDDSFIVASIIITNFVSSEYKINVGDTVADISSNIGEEYFERDNRIIFMSDIIIDTHSLSFVIEENTISEIYIVTEFAAF